jgi:crotonobetainyl-CoA:carnitine CoA-transferase CaiB-like acyl-CoA transferase
MGADVIKVEHPAEGDETRGWGPPFDDEGQSAYFLAVNRNKKSVALDLSTGTDREVLLDLTAGADVLLENFLPRSLEKLRLEPAKILARHPSLIWCTISGFGSNSQRPGYDFVIQAESGWMSITGEDNGPPMKTGVALADVIAGKDAVAAILAAVITRGERSLTVQERRITISLDASARAALINTGQNFLVSGNEAKRWGNAHPNLVPYQLFDAEDRPLVVAVGSDLQWVECAKALGLGEMANDDSLRTNAGRVMNRERVVSAIGRRVREERADYWIERLERSRVPCGLVRTVSEALSGTGASARTGIPSAVPGSIRFPPPHLDEHGKTIRAMGWRVFQR